MNVDELAAKYGLTNEWIEESAAAYERGDYPHEDGQVYSGSHLDAVGKKRVTVVYPCEKVQRANRIAKSRGVKPSEIYRDALAEYLDKYETVHPDKTLRCLVGSHCSGGGNENLSI